MSTEKLSLKKSIVVEASRAKAFKVFTEHFDEWWPREHKIGPAALKRAVIETKNGGRWFEIDEDGSECNWGKVVVYDPPNRLLLNWQITAAWQFDERFVTEIEVLFIAEGEKRTRVELEHRQLERYGDKAIDMKKTFEAEGGWAGLLELFRQRATK